MINVFGGFIMFGGGFVVFGDEYWFVELNLNLMFVVCLDCVLLLMMLVCGLGVIIYVSFI